ncbi:hypothetical protein [Chryseobacterium taiwanense]|uniref:LysM domain-containing protein n=1 Tax=Chryseobacterium taiwanense TaxID=363331 RepID=A0A0B4E6F9_9FLAO|nr:hypothetical protein [Chryseobacterium taiwanense]KIC62213.1 hypothetical protein RM51_13205 [Chryseobacterium taiwanense]
MITYIALPGDTLEKISSDLKVENPIYLREFHNTHCAKHERFHADIKPGQSLLLPFGNEIKNLNKKIIENGDSLYYHPPHGKIPFQVPLLKGKYKINHQKFLDDKLVTDYQYQLELRYIKFENSHYIFSFQMSDFKKEGIESDTKISSLAKACMEILYPLEIRLNETGELRELHLTSPENLLKDHLETLKSYFTDSYSATYIDQMKLIIDDRKALLKNLKNTLSIYFLVGSFYRALYGDWADSQIYQDFLPWLTNASPIRFALQNKIILKDDNNILKVTQEGNSSDYRSMDQLYFNSHIYDEKAPVTKNSVDCNHFAVYNFNRADLSIQKIDAIFNSYIDDVIEKETFIIERQQD